MALDALYLQMHGLRWQRLDDHLPMRARRRGDDVEADAGAAGAEAGAAGAPAAAEDEPVPFLARWRAATWAGRGELLLTSLFAFAERLALLLLLIAALIPAFVALAYASFLLLLLVSAAVSFTSEHAMWVFIALWLTYGLHAVNGRMRTQLVVNDERHPLHLSVLVLMLCAMVFLTVRLFDPSNAVIGRHVWFAPPHPLPASAAEVLWRTVLTDLIVRYLSTAAKLLVTLALARRAPMRQLQRLFLGWEMAWGLYRSLLPTQWYGWWGERALVTGDFGGDGSPLPARWRAVVAFLFLVALLVKTNLLLFQLRQIGTAFRSRAANRPLYGRYATDADLAEHGDEPCPICYCELSSPVTLTCGHTFCEHCVALWLERDNSETKADCTCPMCRARVFRGDPIAWYKSDGTTPLLCQFF